MQANPAHDMHASVAVSVNGAQHVLQSGDTVAHLVRELTLENKRIAVELNGHIVARGRYAETHLRPGDRLEIVGAVGGG